MVLLLFAFLSGDEVASGAFLTALGIVEVPALSVTVTVYLSSMLIVFG